MSLMKPALAAIAVTTALAGIAYAQQSSDTPPATQVQEQQQTDNPPQMRRRYGADRFEPGMRPGRMCGERAERFAERRIERIERATRPTAGQQAALDALKAAGAKAADIVKAACPKEVLVTPPGRLAMAEARLSAMLEAIRIVKPAMEAYYNSLSDEQKARLYLSRRPMERFGERRGEWRGMHRGEFREGDRDQRFERRNDRRDDGATEERGERTDNNRSDDLSEPL